MDSSLLYRLGFEILTAHKRCHLSLKLQDGPFCDFSIAKERRDIPGRGNRRAGGFALKCV